MNHADKVWIYVGNIYAGSFSSIHQIMRIQHQSKDHYYTIIENAGNDISKIRESMNDATLLYILLYDRIHAIAMLSGYDEHEYNDYDVTYFHTGCLLEVIILVDVTEVSMIKLQWPQIKLKILGCLPDKLNYTKVIGHDPIRTIL